MALGKVVTIAATPTLVSNNVGAFFVRNPGTAGSFIYLGGSAVAASGGSQGYPLDGGQFLSITSSTGADLWGIVTSGTLPLNILEVD